METDLKQCAYTYCDFYRFEKSESEVTVILLFSRETVTESPRAPALPPTLMRSWRKRCDVHDLILHRLPTVDRERHALLLPLRRQRPARERELGFFRGIVRGLTRPSQDSAAFFRILQAKQWAPAFSNWSERGSSI